MYVHILLNWLSNAIYVRMCTRLSFRPQSSKICALSLTGELTVAKGKGKICGNYSKYESKTQLYNRSPERNLREESCQLANCHIRTHTHAQLLLKRHNKKLLNSSTSFRSNHCITCVCTCVYTQNKLHLIINRLFTPEIARYTSRYSIWDEAERDSRLSLQ